MDGIIGYGIISLIPIIEYYIIGQVYNIN